MKKIITILCILSLFIAVVGCSRTTQETSGPTEIKFKDMTAVSTLRKLDGKEVQITGFMAETSPLDGSMIYLMNLPYQNCVYCVPNTNQLVNTMAAYPKIGKKIEFTDVPVDIVGTLKFEDITDSMGYSYSYRIVDAEVTPANVKELGEAVKVYTQLVDKGFVVQVSNIMMLVDDILYAQEFGTETGNIEFIPEELVYELYDMFEGLDQSQYADMLEVVEVLEQLVQGINYSLESGDYSRIDEFLKQNNEVFYKVYDWLMQVEL